MRAGRRPHRRPGCRRRRPPRCRRSNLRLAPPLHSWVGWVEERPDLKRTGGWAVRGSNLGRRPGASRAGVGRWLLRDNPKAHLGRSNRMASRPPAPVARRERVPQHSRDSLPGRQWAGEQRLRGRVGRGAERWAFIFTARCLSHSACHTLQLAVADALQVPSARMSTLGWSAAPPCGRWRHVQVGGCCVEGTGAHGTHFMRRLVCWETR